MVHLVSFDPGVEERVRFIEETRPGDIVDRTLDRLEAGEDARDLVVAAALAVSRSSELPSGHHGGPIHPVAGIHAVLSMMDRLDGEDSRLPAIQSVALACKHIHLPSMGPTAMVRFDDLNRDVSPERILERLSDSVRAHEMRLAERALTLACETVSPGRILDCLLPVALERNVLDDHYFLYLVYAMRALDGIGWQWGPVLLRPVVRYLARHAPFSGFGEFDQQAIDDGIAFHKRLGELDALMDRYHLTPETVPLKTGPSETAAIEEFADRVGAVASIAELPGMVAEAMGSGLSLEGACEALSIGGARIFLRSHTANPFDVHIHTGISARRYVIGFPEISFRSKCLSLLGWAWSYEIRYLDSTLTWDWQGSARAVVEPAKVLLDRIEETILAIDGYDVTRLEVPINELVAQDAVRDVVNLARAFVQAGYDTGDLFTLATRLACREDASEMHGYKIQQAALEEYRLCRAPLNWVHAVAAVKQCSVTAPVNPKRFYPRYASRLAA
ncbi:MAG: hypothetical protein OXI95_12850 [bacterium]|nr:hypothetical protein [bacterium]MDE0417804.1 hypothetical protein [bacterium]